MMGIVKGHPGVDLDALFLYKNKFAAGENRFGVWEPWLHLLRLERP